MSFLSLLGEMLVDEVAPLASSVAQDLLIQGAEKVQDYMGGAIDDVF